MKKIIVFDLVSLLLSLFFGFLAYRFQGLFFITGLIKAISITFFIALIFGLIITFIKILEDL